MKALLLIVWVSIFCACSVKTGSNPLAVHFNNIGVDNYNSFIYAVKMGGTAPGVVTDTIGLFCSDLVLPQIDSQKCMQWQVLSINSNKQFFIPAETLSNTSTGIKINDTLLYIHPPREGVFKILQFAPHPLFQNMGRIGNTWAWDFDIGKAWAIDSLYPIRDVETFHNTYTFMDTVRLQTLFGRLLCYHIAATGVSKYGRSTASYYLNEKFGIVKSAVVCTNGQTFDFTLLLKIEGINGMGYNTGFIEMNCRSQELKLKSRNAWY